MQIGQKIRSAREDLDLTQEEVAAQIPMNQSSYSKIERDMQEPNLEQLRRICQILGVNAEYLLSLGRYAVAENAPDIQFAKGVKALYQKIYKK